MTDSVEFSCNRATGSQVASHLSRCDVDFAPPLSGRVDIDPYAEKIVDIAVRFEAWAGDNLVGLVAAYCNDSERRSAYITSVSVLRERHGQGIASRLLVQCIEHVKEEGFKRIELEVNNENGRATKLYEKKGFVIHSVSGSQVVMRLDLSARPFHHSA